MGFFIRPKSATRDDDRGMVFVEAIGVVASYENEFMETTGHDSAVNTSGAIHRRGPARPGPGNIAPVPVK